MNSAQQLWLEQIGSVLETLNQGVIINDERRQIVFANSMFVEMIKMQASDLVGHSIINLYPPEDVPKVLEFISRRETHGRTLYEFYIPQADGGRLPVAVTSRQVLAVGQRNEHRNQNAKRPVGNRHNDSGISRIDSDEALPHPRGWIL